MAEGRGFVYLVGAGPGNAWLLTLRGLEALHAADAVVFDRLVGDEVMELVPDTAEKISVGKSAGSHQVPQEDINELLVSLARSGKTVVRLKGGDCFLFGRGGEELEALEAGGIDFEVVPGVPSPVGAAAYAGIPLTHRDCAASVHIVTGHRRSGGEKPDYGALAACGGTLVFMMAVASFPDIAAELIRAGMDPETPCAAVQNGTSSRQRRLLTVLGKMPEAMRREKIEPPALMIVGEVCRYAEKFDWYTKTPLFGRRILVTAPEKSSKRLASALHGMGAEVFSHPCIKTEARSFEIPSPAGFEAAAFTSAFGVSVFFDALGAAGLDARYFAGMRVSAVGPGTAGELARHGLRADIVPPHYDTAALASSMTAKIARGSRVLLPRAAQTGDELCNALAAAGIEPVTLQIYDTLPLPYDGPDPRELDAAVFTSSMAVRSLAAAVTLHGVRAVCIGDKTAAAACEAGAEAYVSPQATFDSLCGFVQEVLK